MAPSRQFSWRCDLVADGRMHCCSRETMAARVAGERRRCRGGVGTAACASCSFGPSYSPDRYAWSICRCWPTRPYHSLGPSAFHWLARRSRRISYCHPRLRSLRRPIRGAAIRAPQRPGSACAAKTANIDGCKLPLVSIICRRSPRGSPLMSSLLRQLPNLLHLLIMRFLLPVVKLGNSGHFRIFTQVFQSRFLSI